MIDLSVFTVAQLQTVIQFMTVCESASVTDIRFVRTQIHDHIAAQMIASKREYRQATSPQQRREHRTTGTARRSAPLVTERCPSCGGAMGLVINSDGLDIIGCNGCRYSVIQQERI